MQPQAPGVGLGSSLTDGRPAHARERPSAFQGETPTPTSTPTSRLLTAAATSPPAGPETATSRKRTAARASSASGRSYDDFWWR